MNTHAGRPLRILLSAYACEPGKGSEPGVGWNWALALARRGHDVWVLTRRNNRAAIEPECARLDAAIRKRLHFLYYDVPRWASWWKKGGRGVQLYYALWQRGVVSVARRAHSAHSFDVVHHLTFGVWRQPSLLYKLQIPMVFGPVGGGEMAPWSLARGLPSFKARLNEVVRYMINSASLLNPVLRRCLREARWIISKTAETDAWVRKLGVHGLVSLEIGIHPGADLQIATTRGARSLRCLYAGRLIGWKGIHLALQSLAKATGQGAEITLTVVGDGPLRSKLEDMSCKLGLENRVTFTGRLQQEELFKQYREHDLLLFPSLHDSSGNVILESLAYGMPVVCLKLGGPGVMVDETCGIAVDVTGLDEEAVTTRLADVLTKLSGSPDWCARLRQGAIDKARTATWDAVADRIYVPIEHDLFPES